MHILAATDFSTRSQRALRRAGLLAHERGAELTLVHVVDDDQPSDLVALETREAERILDEQIGAMPELRHVRCRPLVVTGDPFDAILRTAASGVDLIVMGAHRRQLLRDIFIGTSVERVIRTGPHPVLMVNREAGGPYRTVLAALDLSEPSVHALRTSIRLRLLQDAQLTVVHAFLPLAKGKMSYAGLSTDSIDDYVASERLRAANELTTFLDASGMTDYPQSTVTEEGSPFKVIARAVRRLHSDVLVMGTHGRSAVGRALLGSVSEQVLRSLDVDILAVPPAR